MILFINLYFSDGDLVQSSTNLVTDFLTYFGAIGIPLLIFYFTIRHDKKKELREIKRVNDDKELTRKKREKDTLRYFIELLRSVIKSSKKQSLNIQIVGKELGENPFNSINLSFVINEDLKRILQDLNHQRLFNAFTNNHGDSEADILNFQKLFGRLDFIQASFENIEYTYNNYTKEDFEKKEKYKFLVEEQILSTSVFIGNKIKMLKLKGRENQLAEVLSRYIILYHTQIVATNSLVEIQDKFINPLKKELWENFRDDDGVFSLVDNCRKATWLYAEIEYSNKNFSEDLLKTHKNISDTIIELIDLSKYFFSKETMEEMKQI